MGGSKGKTGPGPWARNPVFPLLADLVVLSDDSGWAQASDVQRVCANSSSFTVPSYANACVDVAAVPSQSSLLHAGLPEHSCFLARRVNRGRKEATKSDLQVYRDQFAEAKRLEYQSWVDMEVFELVDMR